MIESSGHESGACGLICADDRRRRNTGVSPDVEVGHCLAGTDVVHVSLFSGGHSHGVFGSSEKESLAIQSICH
jgi:hypothetical protein